MATVEWELPLTEDYVEKNLCEHIGVAISIAHLRAIRQCLAENPHKGVCIFEDDIDFTSFFGHCILAALFAISGCKRGLSTWEAFDIVEYQPSILYLSKWILLAMPKSYENKVGTFQERHSFNLLTVLAEGLTIVERNRWAKVHTGISCTLSLRIFVEEKNRQPMGFASDRHSARI